MSIILIDIGEETLKEDTSLVNKLSKAYSQISTLNTRLYNQKDDSISYKEDNKVINYPNMCKYGSIFILGLIYEIVVFNPMEVGLKCDNFGKHIPSLSRISISTLLSKNQFNLTLHHEVVHIILDAIGESELSNNEDFVEKLARAIMQVATLNVRANND